MISSLQKSSPNACCREEFHTLPVRLSELSEGFVKLDTLACFGSRSIFSNRADKRSGLGLGLGDPNGISGVLRLEFE